MNKIYIASDHAGFELKNKLVNFFKKEIDISDLGAHEYDEEDDYPDYAAKVCDALKGEPNAKGILVCGTGQGMDRVANKYAGLDAAVVWDEFSTKVAKEHGLVRVLCLGARSLSFQKAKKLINLWLCPVQEASIGERHQRRLEKIRKIERLNMIEGEGK